MNDLRRGNPKKRFLWRRLPSTSNISDDTNKAEAEDGSNDVNAKLKMACHESNHKKLMQSFHIASPVISPPLSEEEEEAHQSSPTSVVSLPPRNATRQDHNPIKDDNSEEESHNKSTEKQQSSENQVETIRAAPRRPLPLFPRPFLASIDSPLNTLRATISEDSGGSQSLATKSESTASKEGKEPVKSEEKSPPENTPLVLSTAASVLLLMRFSVTDQALNCLARGGSKPKKEVKGKKNEATNGKEITTKSILQSEATPSTHLVSPESSRKACVTRMVSMPTATAKTQLVACPNRLATPEDPNELNSLHCFVRAHLLEVFSLPPQKDKPGRVGLRCVFCAHLPRKDRSGTTMCTFYPKSLQDLYRSVMTWQRIHFRGCKHVNPKRKEEYWKHKESDQTRGKTTYWVTSAMRLGLQDINNGRNGICVARPS